MGGGPRSEPTHQDGGGMVTHRHVAWEEEPVEQATSAYPPSLGLVQQGPALGKNSAN